MHAKQHCHPNDEEKALLSDKLQHTLEDTRHQWHPPEFHSVQMWGPGPVVHTGSSKVTHLCNKNMTYAIE